MRRTTACAGPATCWDWCSPSSASGSSCCSRSSPWATTEGVTEDVQSAFARLLRQFIQVPLNLVQAAVILSVPWIVVVERLTHRAFRQVLEALAAGLIAAGLASFAATALAGLSSPALTRGLSVPVDGVLTVVIPPFVTAISAFLTTSGSRDQRRTVAWSWNLYWLALTIAVITGELSLPGVLVTVLLGRAVGLGVRYAAGVYNERAYGATLVEGIRRTGLDPVRVVRVGEIREGVVPHTELASTTAPIGHTEAMLDLLGRGSEVVFRPTVPHTTVTRAASGETDPVGVNPAALPVPPRPAAHPEPAESYAGAIARAGDAAARALERPGQGRVYAVTDADGVRWDVVVLDGDRQVIGWLASAWASLRLHGHRTARGHQPAVGGRAGRPS